MAQLEIVNDSAWNTRAPDSYPCSLEVRTQDGRDELVEVPYPPGFSRGRLDAETVVKKFHGLTASILAQDASDRIIERVMALDESAFCADLMEVGSGLRGLIGARIGAKAHDGHVEHARDHARLGPTTVSAPRAPHWRPSRTWCRTGRCA